MHAPDTEGDSPLHVAAAYGSVASVRLLLAASAHVGAANLRLETALTTAVDTGAQAGEVAVLMQADWPDAWRTVLLMNLSILCRALGTPRFRLFAVCRALSYHQEFYPLWGSQINGKCENANKAFVVSSFPHNSTNLNKCFELQAGATSLAGTPLWCDRHDSEEHCQCHPCHTAGGALRVVPPMCA